MNIRKNALLGLAILSGAIIFGSSAWADRDDWGRRGYRASNYQQTYNHNYNNNRPGFLSRVFGGGGNRYCPPPSKRWHGRGNAYGRYQQAYAGRGFRGNRPW